MEQVDKPTCETVTCSNCLKRYLTSDPEAIAKYREFDFQCDNCQSDPPVEQVAMPVYQDLLAMSVVQVSEIEGLKAGARTAQAEIGRLEAAAKYCEDNHCDVDEIERLRAALLKEGIRSTERERAALEEAAKIAEDGWELPEAIAAAIRAKAKEVQGE